MTWIKLPDDALDDPQVADVAPEAVVAYLRTLGWSNRWARDGLVPVSIAGEHATAWLAGGLAEQSEVGIQLAWLLEYQPEADEIAARKRDAVNRQKRHRRHMAGDHSQCDPKRCLVLLSATRDQTRDQRRDQRTLRSDPSPSLPDPKGRGEETGEGDDGPLVPVASPERNGAAKRRELAKAIRECTDDLLRKRYRKTFDREYGTLYPRQVPA